MGAARTTGVFLESVGEVVTDSTVTGLRWLPVFFLHALVSLALTYPLVSELTGSFVAAPAGDGDALARNFFVWRWQAERLALFFANYWSAPVHYPATDALAFFDPQPLSGAIFAGLSRLSGNPVLAFNGVVLLCLTLNGVAFSALSRALKAGWGSAIALGVLGQASPIALAQLSDPTLMATFPLVFGIAALGRYSVTGELRWAIAVGLCVVVAYGVSSALLVVMSIVLPLLAVLLPAGKRWLWTVGNLVPVGVGTAVVLAYPVWRQTSALLAATARETPSVAHPGRWWAVAEGSLLDRLELFGAAPDRFVLYPGLVVTGLALFGLGLGLRTYRRWVLAAAVSGALAFVLTLAGGEAGRAWPLVGGLEDVHPGLALLRHREVFGSVTHVMLVGLAAVTMARLEPPRLQVRRRLALTAVLLGVLEGVALPATRIAPPSVSAQPWMIALEGTESAAIAHVGPAGFGPSWQDLHDSLIHGRALVGGPTAFVPEKTKAFERRLEGFPSEDGVRHLRANGVGTLVVAKEWLSPERAKIIERAKGTKVAFEDDSVKVYALMPASVDERALDAAGPPKDDAARDESAKVRTAPRKKKPRVGSSRQETRATGE